MEKIIKIYLLLGAVLLFLSPIGGYGTEKRVAAADNGRRGLDAALHSSNHLRARRLLQEVVAKPRPRQEAAASEWTQALLALIDLERLLGDQEEGRKLFRRCDKRCPQLTGDQGWRALREWACRGKQKSSACRLKFVPL